MRFQTIQGDSSNTVDLLVDLELQD